VAEVDGLGLMYDKNERKLKIIDKVNGHLGLKTG